MARKRVAPMTPVPEDKPSTAQPVIVSPPKTEVNGEGTRSDDGKTTNELVVQKISVPFTFKVKGGTKTEFEEYLRIFVRPDESHDEPDASWDEHEPEDEAALKQIFATYGKGSGTAISVRMNVVATGDEEFFLDVRHPKPEGDEDEKLPSVLIDPQAMTIGDVAQDLYYAMNNKFEDPPADFKTRARLEEEAEEYSHLEDDRTAIEDLLSEFDMPGDKPAHLYDLLERLRSIFETAKGKTK